jgi:hypothetical protein
MIMIYPVRYAFFSVELRRSFCSTIDEFYCSWLLREKRVIRGFVETTRIEGGDVRLFNK